MTNLVLFGFQPLLSQMAGPSFLYWSKDLGLLAIVHGPFVTYIALDRLPFDYRLKYQVLDGKRPWSAKRETAIYGGNGHTVASLDAERGLVIRRKKYLIEIPLPRGVTLKDWTVFNAA